MGRLCSLRGIGLTAVKSIREDLTVYKIVYSQNFVIFRMVASGTVTASWLA